MAMEAKPTSRDRKRQRGFSIWRETAKMAKESNGPPSNPPRNNKDLSGRELLLKIMELTAAKDITDYELQEILGSIERILSETKAPDKH